MVWSGLCNIINGVAYAKRVDNYGEIWKSEGKLKVVASHNMKTISMFVLYAFKSLAGYLYIFQSIRTVDHSVFT